MPLDRVHSIDEATVFPAREAAEAVGAEFEQQMQRESGHYAEIRLHRDGYVVKLCTSCGYMKQT